MSDTPPVKRRGRRRRVLIVLVLVYAGVMTFGGCADKLLLYPSSGPTDVAGIERVTLRDPKLEYFKARPVESSGSAPSAYVLAFTGNAGRAEYEAEDIAAEWEKQPVEIWAMNYPGYGNSAGPATLKSIYVSALQAYDELAAHVGGKAIYISGRSLGTTAALYVASQRPVAGLVLQNPPPLRRVVMGHGWWNLWLLAVPVAMQVPSQLDSIDNAKHVTAPAPFLLAQQDTVVKPKYAKKVFDAYAGPTRLIQLPQAGHNDPFTSDEQRQVTEGIDWLIHFKR